jgi:hypothetical protein
MYRITGLLLVALVLVGCQALGNKPSAPTTMASDDRAIASVSNQGTVVFLPGHGNEIKTLSASGTAVCAQCKADAGTYFSTGVLTEKCSACGATRSPLMRSR